jgi:peptide/nickel transport system substrate-binding protein
MTRTHQSPLSRMLRTGAAAVAALVLATGSTAFAQTRGGVVGMIANPEPASMMLAMNSVVTSQYMGSKIFQGLLTYDSNLKPRPELAKSWKVSDDGLTYNFELQPGVKWHDGKPFTAADAEFSIGKLVPAVHARSRVVLNNYVASVKATGPLSLEIKLKSPFPSFISMFEVGTLPMLPKHLYDGTDFATNPANQKPVGTGPFVFKEWRRGAFIKMDRNPDYWKKGQPYLDGLVFYVMPDAASRVVAFEKGEVTVLRTADIEVSDLTRLRKQPGNEHHTKGWEFFSPTFHLQVNMRNPPFDNVKIRQAMQHAIDRNFIVQTIFEGMNRPATGAFSATEMFYEKNVPQYAFDPNKAKALIKESGVDLSKTPIKFMTIPLGANYDRLFEYCKQMMEQVGFKVTMESADSGTWAKKMSNWEFDMTLNLPYQYGDPALGVERLYVSKNIVKGSPFANNQGYSNPKADELWAKAGSEMDPYKRKRFYGELQTILAQDVANQWLFDIEYTTLSKSNVKNVVTSGHYLTDSMDSVWIAK